MEFSILNQEEETPYQFQVQGFRIGCNISSVMNQSYCKVATSIMMLFHLIINNEDCCVAGLLVLCSIYSDVFLLKPSRTISRGKRSLFPINGEIWLTNIGECGGF